MTIPRILIIAGSDSGGGAGIQADIKTVTMLGGYATTAITAITAQNTLGVQRVMPVPADMVLAQIDSVVSDIGVDAVKIGMIGSPETANAVADYLSSPSFPRTREPISRPESHEQAPEMGPRLRGGDDHTPIVFDPVMVATSGSTLADAPTVTVFDRLMQMATIVTPNTPELAALSGREIGNELDQSRAAEEIMARTGCPAVLAKGGHLIQAGETHGVRDDGKPFRYPNASRVFDYLYRLEDKKWSERLWDSPRQDTRSTHGTGCTLASAIATGIGAGLDLETAIKRAIRFVRLALINNPGLGQGHGPMGHALGVAPFDELEG